MLQSLNLLPILDLSVTLQGMCDVLGVTGGSSLSLACVLIGKVDAVIAKRPHRQSVSWLVVSIPLLAKTNL